MKALVLAGLSAAALLAAGCGNEKAPAPVAEAPAAEQPVQVASAPQGPAPVTGTVNWEAARADLAKRPADVVVPQAAGSDPLVVPMLLPAVKLLGIDLVHFGVLVWMLIDVPWREALVTWTRVLNLR